MREFDLTTQSAICGDMVSNLAMIVQQLERGEQAKVILPGEYKESLKTYEEALKMMKAKIVESKEEDGKLIIIIEKEA